MTRRNVRRKSNGHRWRTLQARVYASHDTCALCGRTVDKALPRYRPDGRQDPLSKSVDHIVPVSLGGKEYDLANLQLAHLGCNMRKGKGSKRAVRPAKQVVASPIW